MAGWIVGLLVFLPLFALRAMGGGDVKLLAAFGAWLGPALVFWVAVYGAIAGGLLALLLVLWRGPAARDDREHVGHRDPLASVGAEAAPRRDARQSRRGADALRAADRARGAGHAVAAGVVRDNAVVVRLPARVRSQAGAELVEFALVLPILLLVFGGIVDFGLLLQRQQVVTNAAREGARLAVLPGYTQRRRPGRASRSSSARACNSDSAAPATDGDAGDADARRRTGLPGGSGSTVTLADRFLILGPIVSLAGGSGSLWHDCLDRDHYHACRNRGLGELTA